MRPRKDPYVRRHFHEEFGIYDDRLRREMANPMEEAEGTLLMFDNGLPPDLLIFSEARAKLLPWLII
jgi:hypothetical protein